MNSRALALAAALAALPASADYLERGQAAFEARDFKAAIRIYSEAVKAEPDNAEFHFRHGAALAAGINEVGALRKLGMARDMRTSWERAVELDPDHADARASLYQYYMNAPRIAGGDREKAAVQLAEFARIVKSRPDDIDLRMGHAFLCQQAEDWTCAAEAFEAVVAVEPDRMMAWYQIGRTALRSGERPDRGAEALLRYLEHTPAENEPSIAWAHTRLGQLYAAQGRTDDARAQLTAALALEPDHDEAKKAMRALTDE